jgi:magnesium-transporting ATPase (P-type)
MIAKDVLDDTEADLNHQAKRRPLVIVWWVAFVVLLVELVAIRGSDVNTLDDLSDNVTKSIVAIVVRIVAVVPAILVVRQITAAQTARMARGAA